MNNQIGIHLRLNDAKIAHIVDQAHMFNLSRFQFFVTAPPHHDKYLKISSKDKTLFKKEFGTQADLYIHSSYWINPSTGKKESAAISEQLLKKELLIAKQLGVKSLVLHPGSAKGYPYQEDDPFANKRGIQALSKMLNRILKNETDVSILLENTAHGNYAIGSDLNDFIAIKNYMEFPEKVGFCIDLAHAYSFGYNLAYVDDFAHLLEKTIGLNTIKLIHLNDTEEQLGSKKDRHAFPGLGKIGKQTITQIINSIHFKNIPKICEIPLLEVEKIKEFILEINSLSQ